MSGVAVQWSSTRSREAQADACPAWRRRVRNVLQYTALAAVVCHSTCTKWS